MTAWGLAVLLLVVVIVIIVLGVTISPFWLLVLIAVGVAAIVIHAGPRR